MIKEVKIRDVCSLDMPVLKRWDCHIFPQELQAAADKNRILIAQKDGSFAGFLRYGLFRDSIPFMNLLFLLEEYRNQGIGTALVAFWEDRMRKEGFSRVMTSTQSDESAQHFYRKLGYMDTGALVLPEQPMEIILRKEL